MTGIDFYVDALLSGLVCGVGPGSTADEIESALGRDFVDDARKQRMRRDYGLLEFYFDRVKQAWICVGSTIQVHRLLDADLEIVPSAVADRYSAFATTLGVKFLAEAVSAKGGPDLVRESATGEFVRYHLHGTGRFVHARQIQAEAVDACPGLEEVWSIEIRGSAGPTAQS
jgi:hypothetical protein